MTKRQPLHVNSDPFYAAFRGAFTNLLRWDDLDRLWGVLRAQAGDGWFVYAIGEPAPETPLPADAIRAFISEIDALLRREHQEDYCGIVYVDDKTDPTFVKIYDPGNLGVVCGYSDNPPVPGWILSRVTPKSLEDKGFRTGTRRTWWRRLWN